MISKEHFLASLADEANKRAVFAGKHSQALRNELMSTPVYKAFVDSGWLLAGSLLLTRDHTQYAAFNYFSLCDNIYDIAIYGGDQDIRLVADEAYWVQWLANTAPTREDMHSGAEAERGNQLSQR